MLYHRKKCRHSYACRTAPVKSDIIATKTDERGLNDSIVTAIKDCDSKGFTALKGRFEKLCSEGTIQEKSDFVYNNKRTYDFPRRLFTGTEKTYLADVVNDQQKSNKACLTWSKKEECTTGQKEVCNTACAAGVLVCIAVAGVAAPVCTIAAPVCSIACHFVSDTTCTTYLTCEVEGSWPGMLPIN